MSKKSWFQHYQDGKLSYEGKADILVNMIDKVASTYQVSML